MKKTIIKLLSSTLALTLVLASAGAAAKADIKTEEIKTKAPAVVEHVKEEKAEEKTGILAAVEKKVAENTYVKLAAEKVVPVIAEEKAEKAVKAAEEKAAPVIEEVKIAVPEEAIAAPEAQAEVEEPAMVWNISATEKDDVTMKFYAQREQLTEQVGIEKAEDDVTKGVVYITGTGAMEANVYENFITVESYLNGIRKVFFDTYGIEVELEYDETLEDLFEIDGTVRVFAAEATDGIEIGDELKLTDEMAAKIDYSSFLKFSPTKIIISEGITNIAKWAFCGCSDLTEVVIPSTVKVVEAGAFQHCTSLTSVVLPIDAVLENGAFYECSSLKSVEFKEAATEDQGAMTVGLFDIVYSESQVEALIKGWN